MIPLDDGLFEQPAETDKTMSDYFKRIRTEWIVEMIDIYGFINREHLMKKFGISIPQASYDLRDVMSENPDLMIYDRRAKRYVAKKEMEQ